MAGWNESIMAVSMLQATAEDAAQRERRLHRVLSVLVIGALAVVLGLLGMECYHLWFAWHGGDQQSWKDFWDTNKNLWWAVPLWLGWPRLREQFGVVFGMAQTLRRAFADRNTGIGEPAPEQPAPLSSPELPIGTVRLGPFASSRYREPRAMVSVGVLSGVFGVVLIVAVVVLYNTRTGDPGADLLTQVLTVVCGVMAVLCFVALGYMLWLVRHWRRGMWLAADDWGVRRIRARRLRERIEVPWHEARAFFRMEAPSDQKHALRTVYGLYGGDRLLAWAVTERAGAEQVAANDRLCRLIVTRTNLPLREINAESVLPMDEEAAAPADASPPQAAPSGTVLSQSWRAGCALVLVCLLVPLVGWIVQISQGR